MPNYRVMPPWAENGYFEDPVITGYTLGNAPPWVQVARANPRRIALLFSAPSTSTVAVTFNPNGTGPGVDFISLAFGQLPLAIHQSEWGPLVSRDWYGGSTILGAKIVVVELIIREWPGGG